MHKEQGAAGNGHYHLWTPDMTAALQVLMDAQLAGGRSTLHHGLLRKVILADQLLMGQDWPSVSSIMRIISLSDVTAKCACRIWSVCMALG